MLGTHSWEVYQLLSCSQCPYNNQRQTNQPDIVLSSFSIANNKLLHEPTSSSPDAALLFTKPQNCRQTAHQPSPCSRCSRHRQHQTCQPAQASLSLSIASSRLAQLPSTLSTRRLPSCYVVKTMLVNTRPAIHLRTIYKSQTDSNTSALSSLSASFHCQQQTCTHIYLFCPRLYVPYHSVSVVHTRHPTSL